MAPEQNDLESNKAAKARAQRERNRTRREMGLCLCGAFPAATGRTLCEGCLVKAKARQSKYRAERPDEFRNRYHARKIQGICVSCGVPGKEMQSALCVDCAHAERQRAVRTKYAVMQMYGGACTCCGETVVAFLTLDHIHNDGHVKRRSGEHGGGSSWYTKLLRQPIDPTLQVLCWNCNMGKRTTGVCPHKDQTYYTEALSRPVWSRQTRDG